MTRLLRKGAPLPAHVFFTAAFQSEAAAQVSTARPAKLATEHHWSATPSDYLALVGNKIG